MSEQTTLKATPNAISSPVSAGGVTPCGSPVGRTTDLFGQEVVHASHLVKQVNGRVKKTNGTSGLNFIASSPSAILQQSLESKLRQRMGLNGSPEFALIWKHRAMLSGVPICALRASAHRIAGNDSGSWPTPQSRDHFPPHTEAYIAEKKAQGHGMANLSDVVMTAAWATPTARDMRSEHGSPEMMKRRQERPNGKPLSKQVLDAWATPRANKWGMPDSHGDNQTPLTAQTGKPGVLSPEHSRWLMGYKIAWANYAPTATPSSRKSRKRS